MLLQASRKIAATVVVDSRPKAQQDVGWCRWDQGPEFHQWHWATLRSICGIDIRQVYGSGIRIHEPPSSQRDRCGYCARLLALR